MGISFAVVHTSSLTLVFLIYVTYLIPASIGLCKSCFTCDMLLLFSHSEVSDSFGTSRTVALRGSSVLGIPQARMLASPPDSWAEVSSLGTLERDWSWRRGL